MVTGKSPQLYLYVPGQPGRGWGGCLRVWMGSLGLPGQSTADRVVTLRKSTVSRLWGWKSKIKVAAGLVPLRAVREGLCQAFLRGAYMAVSPPSVSVSVSELPPFLKMPVMLGWGPP